MNDPSSTTPLQPADEPTDLDAARRDVARAEARLSNRWRAAKVAGEKSVGRAMSFAKPVLIGAAVVGGIALLVTSLSRRSRPIVRRVSVPTGPSLLSEVARAAALALASAAARRVAERYLVVPVRPDGGVAGRRLGQQAEG
jgi:hypothetical protein